MRRARGSPRRARAITRGARPAIRTTASGARISRRAGMKSSPSDVARSHCRPSQNPEPSSPSRGPRPPARAQRPRASRASAIDPVPARMSTPARSPSAPSSAACASEMTCTRDAARRSVRATRRRSVGVQTPRDATTRDAGRGKRASVRRRNRSRSWTLVAGTRARNAVRDPRRAITRIHVAPTSTPTIGKAALPRPDDISDTRVPLCDAHGGTQARKSDAFRWGSRGMPHAAL